jgi:hypothetical protein
MTGHPEVIGYRSLHAPGPRNELSSLPGQFDIIKYCRSSVRTEHLRIGVFFFILWARTDSRPPGPEVRVWEVNLRGFRSIQRFARYMIQEQGLLPHSVRSHMEDIEVRYTIRAACMNPTCAGMPPRAARWFAMCITAYVAMTIVERAWSVRRRMAYLDSDYARLTTIPRR